MGKRLTATFLVALVLLLGNALVSFWNVTRVVDHDHRVAHTHEVLAQLRGITSALYDAEAGLSSHFLMGRAESLRPCEFAFERVPEALANLESMTADNRRSSSASAGSAL